ncbi:von Willebrand factor binding protein Vwb [Staphylococcus argenteus]|uniref:von Willebrand factor binding protein Vwb n=1 Tax=Staphylococcus argenteus TaxID=985002 RepID=UPI000501358E|nr:von Willebrand factor binding protein Vwb [Staphylococcus argenteus]API78828.1 coagulase [Staphylococcus argenteus]MBE2123400.1 von Willebrand factor binding protein Vwb [Staphylococcus argenteus]MBE2142673.1 von Willebrand factor binding protein Vwb [Staphylococcus argenteus]MCG6476910.1 von Willebrand factor binding protein Vwb [Staphylococcus argenteus]MCG9806356.1 von Willebrand factor binding protein Vwb [Staphylococcus argenteus]
MKKKLLVLTLGALCVSQIWEHNHASAVVSGEKNPYVSESLNLIDYKNNKQYTAEAYKKSLEDLIDRLPQIGNVKYDEPEFKEAVKKYQQRFMAEDDALKKYFDEERKLKQTTVNNGLNSNILGMTQGRYEVIYEGLKNQCAEFLKEIEQVKINNPQLKDFSWEEQNKADIELNTLENKALMVGATYINEHRDEVFDLYNKLDMILGYEEDERKSKKPINNRMLEQTKEDLETIISEFFIDIKKERPKDIPMLTADKDHNQSMALKLKADTEAAKNDESKRSKRSKRNLDSQIYKTTTQEVSEQQKADYERKAEERKARFLVNQKNNKTPVVSLIDDEDDNENDKQLIVSSPIKRPTPPTTYTETTQQVPMPTVERQTQEQIVYKAPKQLAGLNGESHDFSTTHQSPTTSNNTYSNVVEFDETSALPGRKSGSLVGLSQIDSSHLTEREKRVIKRDHVREAQKLVENYKDTHSYKDRLNAQQKVNTLSEGHQKRFNKQINKVYKGK